MDKIKRLATKIDYQMGELKLEGRKMCILVALPSYEYQVPRLAGDHHGLSMIWAFF
jgi:hypothetical protein